MHISSNDAIVSLCRSISEEYKVPDGMVGFSKLSDSFFPNSYPRLEALEDFHLNLINNPVLINHSSAVIGRGGEQISRIQQDSGCKIQIAPGESKCRALTLCIWVWGSLKHKWKDSYFAFYPTDSGGMPERSVTLTGSPDAIQWVSLHV